MKKDKISLQLPIVLKRSGVSGVVSLEIMDDAYEIKIGNSRIKAGICGNDGRMKSCRVI